MNRCPRGSAAAYYSATVSRIARNSVIFSFATALSRVAGMGREILASSYFGTSGAFSAFTIAFQLPNLLRSLVADAALSAAFVPVFTELLEQGKKREAARLASTLLFLITIVLGALMALFILIAPILMPIFTGDTFTHELDQLTVGLAQVLFPIVVLLGINGLVVGILNSYEHFSLPAFAPLAWNAVIIIVLITLRGQFEGPDQLYAYAIGVLAGTLVQLLMVLPMLKRVGFHGELAFDFKDARVWQVLKLMLPVTLGLGVINFDLVINSWIGTLVSDQAPRAIDAAFRIYMLPQGLFSVALATVLFPSLSRFAARKDLDGMRALMGTGVRQICLLLIPAAALTIALAEPITRIIYQRGAFGNESTEIVSTALFWFSFSMPFAGVNLLLTRTFFSLKLPWKPTFLAVGSIIVNAVLSLLLYKPYGVAGPVIGTVVGSAFMTFAQAWYLRKKLAGKIEGAETLLATTKMLLGAGIAGLVAYLVWLGLDPIFGQDLVGGVISTETISVAIALILGSLAYAVVIAVTHVPEGRQIWGLFASRLRRKRA